MSGLDSLEVGWDDMHKGRLYMYSTVGLMGSRVALYPLMRIKTLKQATSGVKHSIRRSQGVRGLWRGVVPVSVGVVPTQMMYLSVLEVAKARLVDVVPQADARQFLSAVMASLVGSTLGVPLDVVTQRVQLFSPGDTRGNFVPVLRRVLKAEGLAGLYKGFIPSIVQFAPTSGVWWMTYGRARRTLDNLGFFDSLPILRDALGGSISGFTAAMATNPLDVVKTQLQTAGEESAKAEQRYFSLVRGLWREEGIAGFYRGVGPRLVVMSSMGALMISSYEFIKRAARIDLD